MFINGSVQAGKKLDCFAFARNDVTSMVIAGENITNNNIGAHWLLSLRGL